MQLKQDKQKKYEKTIQPVRKNRGGIFETKKKKKRQISYENGCRKGQKSI